MATIVFRVNVISKIVLPAVMLLSIIVWIIIIIIISSHTEISAIVLEAPAHGGVYLIISNTINHTQCSFIDFFPILGHN